MMLLLPVRFPLTISIDDAMAGKPASTNATVIKTLPMKTPVARGQSAANVENLTVTFFQSGQEDW